MITCLIEKIDYVEFQDYMQFQIADAFPALREEERTKAFIDKLYAHADFCFCRDDGHLVGMIAYYANNEGADFAYITQAYVSPNYRRHGLFTRMLDLVIRDVLRKGFFEIRLEVYKKDKVAQRCYAENGFVPMEKARQDTLYMRKPIVMKKLLLLGGSYAQLEVIKKAKSMGYYTVLCDYLLDNPGQLIADSFHLVSTTDKNAVLQVALQEGIDGIVAYGSDPAAPTAAFVANAMNLSGMDYNLVRCFCEKHLFRDFLLQHGFNVPKWVEINAPYEIDEAAIAHLHFPMIVKPTDSSGSKGIMVIEDWSELTDAIDYAKQYSRNGILIIEEFIRRDHPFVIEAEIFAMNGKVAVWGLINSIRDISANPLLPAAYSYPLHLSEKRKQLVKSEVSRLIAITGNTSGAFNIEMIIDSQDRLFILDAGPRSGGNKLPEFISMIAGKDIVEAIIKSAMGDTSGLDVSLDGEVGGYWGLGVLHSSHEGKFQGVVYSDKAKAALVKEDIQKKRDEQVHPYKCCNDLVGLSFLHASSREVIDEVMCDMNHSMRVVIQ